MSFSFGRTSQIDTGIITHLEHEIAKSNILVVSKRRCGACKKAKKLLNKLAVPIGVVPVVFDLNKYSKQQIQKIIKHLSVRTGMKTVPQIWIKGTFIGGNDDIQRIHKEGRLVSLILGKTIVFPTNQESHYGMSQHGSWYQPSKFTVDDDRKYDLPLQKSQSEKWSSRQKLGPTRKSKSSTGWGAQLSKSTKSGGMSWFNSTRNGMLRRSQLPSAPRQGDINTGDSYWLGGPLTMEHSYSSGRNYVSDGVIISRVI